MSISPLKYFFRDDVITFSSQNQNSFLQRKQELDRKQMVSQFLFRPQILLFIVDTCKLYSIATKTVNMLHPVPDHE